jgi:DNA-binding transcriptional ArsR family regulator
MTDEILILEPGDDRANKIAKAMASNTASDILGVLNNGEQTSSEIAHRLGIPITTVSYHIDNLLDAGMIRVAKTRWSKKGREVKVYDLSDQLVIMASPKTDIRSLLLKYASLFSILIVATVLLGAFSPLLSGVPPPMAEEQPARVMEEFDGLKAGGEEPGAVTFDSLMSQYGIVVAFFTGGCMVLLILISYEVHSLYQSKKPQRLS